MRRGEYAIAEIFKPDGIYRLWNWRGLVAYFVGFAVMVPFFSTSIFTGPVASAAGGADFSLFVGLPVSAVLYWLLSRNLDVTSERRVAESEKAAVISPEASRGR